MNSYVRLNVRIHTIRSLLAMGGISEKFLVCLGLDTAILLYGPGFKNHWGLRTRH